MIIHGLEFADNCDGCVRKGEPFSQGDLCCRCPILNCSGDDPCVPPEHYREDWAKEFHRWFAEMKGQEPQLYFTMKKPEEQNDKC